jgi:hypothetical protein
MAFCSQCGMQNPDAANFCNSCGATIAQVLPPAPAAWNAPPPQAVPVIPAYIVVRPPKSVGAAIILAIFFGPLGMLYSTIPGALAMMFISFVLIFLTAGFSVLITWPICIIWSALAAESYNRALC